MADDAPLIATPQAYPLLCVLGPERRYLIVGWTSDGVPVGVPDAEVTTSSAKEITGNLYFVCPNR